MGDSGTVSIQVQITIPVSMESFPTPESESPIFVIHHYLHYHVIERMPPYVNNYCTIP